MLPQLLEQFGMSESTVTGLTAKYGLTCPEDLLQLLNKLAQLDQADVNKILVISKLRRKYEVFPYTTADANRLPPLKRYVVQDINELALHISMMNNFYLQRKQQLQNALVNLDYADEIIQSIDFHVDADKWGGYLIERLCNRAEYYTQQPLALGLVLISFGHTCTNDLVVNAIEEFLNKYISI